ncbi:MAG: NUDIX domain-containing protein [Candidatus Woesearchaeota archaeon]
MGEKTVYSGKFITVKEEPFGNSTLERAYLRPSVQVIPFTKDNKILMIREKRAIEGKSRWKFVSGFMDKPGLSEEQVAQEELMEEAGFAAGNLKKYHYIEDKHSFVIPITYFLAYNLKESKKPNPDGEVVEEVKEFSIEELYQRVLDGEFDFLHEASVIMMLYRDWEAGRLRNP